MRILHILHSLDQRYGGPLRTVLDMSARSLSLGLESEILGFGPLAVPDNPFPVDRIHSLPVTFPKRYCYSPSLPAWIEANLKRFDGVVLHGMWMYPNFAIAEACIRLGIPYACFPHGMLEPWSVFGQGYAKALKKVFYWTAREKRLFRRASAVFFTTERERTLAKGTFVIPSDTFIVVPYGVDPSLVIAHNPDDSLLQIPEKQRVALFLGRVHPKKNVDFLLEAWAAAALDPDWMLVIAGPVEPSYQRQLDRIVERRGLARSVRFVGTVTARDKSYLLGRSAWFLLPSKQENFGVAVLEAINAGCPVAISNQVYLADSFHPDSEVMPVDMATWVEFLRTRLGDEEHRQRLVELDRKYLMPKFGIEIVTAGWVKTLESVFQTKSREAIA